ncbi:MAG: glycosyltransferase family 9 protein [Ignavibacteriae bacterium]|nr:glycosyltransferase family 9 protein [Ignavibacteriota bacterium]
MRAITVNDLKYDCRYFRGDIPCKPHKEHGVHCLDEQGNDCKHYDPVGKKILIIKLGAMGDVIRTTPLLRKLKEAEPKAEIWWLTNVTEILPKTIDVILPFTPQSIATLQAVQFDTIYNLDKDKEACALCSTLSARIKKGFIIKDGKCWPIDQAAKHKYLTGVFDDISKANTKSYQQEIFELCGFTFSGERYIMPEVNGYSWKLPAKKKIIGLNTGCGDRWTSRLWPETYWVTLAKQLKKAGYVPLLLGGEQEHRKNLKIARQSRSLYLGHFSLQQFMSEVNQCDLVVTAVTLALHIAIGLGKKIILFNNIFNRHEFELYGGGEILEPDFDCTCYYSPTCPNNCMKYLSVDRVYDTCVRLLSAA